VLQNRVEANKGGLRVVDRTLRDGSIWFCGLSIRQRWQVWV